MFSVYKITNKINNKCYIGSSIRVEKRWKNHINASQNPNSPRYNYPLYQAFRKYGIDNFIFEVIKDNFENAQEMSLYENAMIIKYDSVNNGYNQTYNTDRNTIAIENLNKHSKKVSQKCAKVDKNENIIEIYQSYHDAARKNGLDADYRATTIRDACKNKISSVNGEYYRDLNENMQVISYPIKKIGSNTEVICIPVFEENDEKIFTTVSEAAKYFNTDRSSIHQCIKGNNRYSVVKNYIFRALDINGDIIENNINIEDKIKEYNKKFPIIKGERKTLTEWCNIYNIKPATVNARIRKGMDVVIAITTPVKG